MASASGPATASPSGIMAIAALLSRVKTRPCMDGATDACNTAMIGPLVIDDIRPIRPIASTARANCDDGTTPASRTLSPRPTRPTNDV